MYSFHLGSLPPSCFHDPARSARRRPRFRLLQRAWRCSSAPAAAPGTPATTPKAASTVRQLQPEPRATAQASPSCSDLAAILQSPFDPPAKAYTPFPCCTKGVPARPGIRANCRKQLAHPRATSKPRQAMNHLAEQRLMMLVHHVSCHACTPIAPHPLPVQMPGKKSDALIALFKKADQLNGDWQKHGSV